jgi:hypothetical protein
MEMQESAHPAKWPSSHEEFIKRKGQDVHRPKAWEGNTWISTPGSCKRMQLKKPLDERQYQVYTDKRPGVTCREAIVRKLSQDNES